MKTILLLVCALGALSTVWYQVAAPSTHHATTDTTLTLAGTIYKAPDSTEAMSQALVGVYTKDRYVAAQTTNAKGQFKFKDLPTETYELRVFVPGYKEHQERVSPEAAQQPLWIGLEIDRPNPRAGADEVYVDGARVGGSKTLRAEDIEVRATRSISSISATTAGVSHADDGVAIASVKGRKRSGKKSRTARTRKAEARGKEEAFKRAESTAVARSRAEAARAEAERTREGSMPSKGDATPPPPPPAPIDAPAEEEIEELAAFDALSEEIAAEDGEAGEKTADDPIRETAGQLTAGVISDHNDWETWKEVVYEIHKTHAAHWALYPTNRYLVQLINEKRLPLPNQVVWLQDAKGNKLWEARTDNTGRAELWYGLDQQEPAKANELTIVASYDGFTQTLKKPQPYEKGLNQMVLKTDCQALQQVEIAWVVDATGSMGDEIRYLQAELSDVINRSQNSHPDVTFKQAAVFYRDEGDDYVTRHHAFTEDLYEVQKFINQQKADGGGDSPEAADKALEVALEELKWSDQTLTKLLFFVLDAPPHHSKTKVKELQELIKKAAQKGIRVIPVASSGIDKKTEYLLRAIALATNGHYAFLTDDSGIGGAHIEPTASVYKVELLNDLLVRLIEQATIPPFCDAAPVQEQDTPPQKNTPKEALTLWPNPATEQVQVTIPKGVKEILITDANGRLLEQWNDLQAGNRRWSVGQYAVGIYFLHYVQDGAQKTERLIVGQR